MGWVSQPHNDAATAQEAERHRETETQLRTRDLHTGRGREWSQETREKCHASDLNNEMHVHQSCPPCSALPNHLRSACILPAPHGQFSGDTVELSTTHIRCQSQAFLFDKSCSTDLTITTYYPIPQASQAAQW